MAPSAFLATGVPKTANGFSVSAGKIPHPCSISFSRTVYFPGGNSTFVPDFSAPSFGFNRSTSAFEIFLGSMISFSDSPPRHGYTRGSFTPRIPSMIS